MNMSDHMKLPVSDRFTLDFDDVLWPIVAHAINQHDKLVEAISLFLAYNDATDDDDNVAMMLMYADALKAAREAIACESE